MHDHPTADGLKPDKPKHCHKAWTSNFKAPSGETVEVAHQGPGVD